MKHQLWVLALTTSKIISNYQQTKVEYKDRLQEYQTICQRVNSTGNFDREAMARLDLEEASQQFYRAETILKVHWTHLWQQYRQLLQTQSQEQFQWFFTELLAVNEALSDISKVVGC